MYRTVSDPSLELEPTLEGACHDQSELFCVAEHRDDALDCSLDSHLHEAIRQKPVAGCTAGNILDPLLKNCSS